MRTAAMVLGILGGLAGLVGGALAFLAGGIVSAFGVDGGAEVMDLSWVAFAASIIGLIGAGVAPAKPKLSALFMTIAAVTGFVVVYYFYILAAVLFGIAALLAFLGGNQKESDRIRRTGYE